MSADMQIIENTKRHNCLNIMNNLTTHKHHIPSSCRLTYLMSRLTYPKSCIVEILLLASSSTSSLYQVVVMCSSPLIILQSFLGQFCYRNIENLRVLMSIIRFIKCYKNKITFSYTGINLASKCAFLVS